MNLHERLFGVPLEAGRLEVELEINSNSEGGYLWEQEMRPEKSGSFRLGAGMTLVAVVGSSEGETVTRLFCCVLEGMPHVRVGVITPDAARLCGENLPEQDGEEGTGRVRRLLSLMADEGCTHVVLQWNVAKLTRQDFAGLRLSVTALIGAGGDRQVLADLLACSDTVVFNLDERDWEEYGNIIPAHVFTYSENKAQADLSARNLRLFPGHVEYEAVALGHIQRIHLPVPGGFSLYHSLCVLACGRCLGLKWERMARVLRCVSGPAGRLEVLSVPAAYTVVLDQADEPRGLEQLLTCVREFTAGQLICVLTCSTRSTPALCAQLGSVAEQLADRIVLTGDAAHEQEIMSAIQNTQAGMGMWQRVCWVEPCRRKAVADALEQAGPGDVVVLTGYEQGAQGEPDERDFVREYVHRRSARRENRTLTGS